MTSMSRLHPSRYLRVAALILSLVSVLAKQAWGGEAYEDLFQSMKARQAQVEAQLMDAGHCFGEGLNGLLKINATCSPEARTLAEAENRDRQALHQLMSTDLGLSAEQVGQERAKRNLDRYRQGVQREVELSPGETTWWDGFPPDPRKTAVSRVLALQYAKIHGQPDATSPVARDNVQQYEAFGVVESTKSPTGEVWFKVTEDYVPKVKPPGWSPRVVGWIAEKDSIPWRRALVMRFTNPLNRDPSLFFRKTDPLLDLARQDPSRRTSQVQAIRSQLSGNSHSTNGVIALEPQVGAKQEHMVMYPVLDFYPNKKQESLRIDGKFARLLEVEARTRSGGEALGGVGGPGDLRIDIVFVMDTTESMRPYLPMVLEATNELVNMSGADAIRFGFIGYRDRDPKPPAGTGPAGRFEYITREYTDKAQLAQDFTRNLGSVKAQSTDVSGDDIPEAVFPGIDTALDSIQWRKDAIKIIFLVGDSPGREEGGLNLRVLRDKANTRQIKVFAFHIKNSAVSGGSDKQAEKQYRELSSTFEGAYGTSRQTSHFLSVDARAADFRQAVLGRFREAHGALDSIRGKRSGSSELPPAPPESLTELIFQQAALLLPDSSLPDQEIRGWVCDKVLTNPGREALAPMILLTESELGELDQRVEELKGIGEAALRGEGGTTLDFFDLVSKNTRFTMVNPTAVNFRDAFSVPLGIDQLPYESDIMAATRDEFQDMGRVQDFVRSMNNKLAHYEDLKRRRGDPAVWKKLSRGAQERDSVVGVELNQLP